MDQPIERPRIGGAKFRRQYDRSREAFAQATAPEPGMLNLLNYVLPLSFDLPQVRRRAAEMFGRDKRPLDLYSLNLAREFRRSKALKIAVCCMPKSGSTYLLTSLARIKPLGLRRVYLHVPYMNPDFVEGLACEQEIDELAVLIHELMGRPYIAHMHTKCSGYTERMLISRNIRPIVLFRNIFDCIVSLDDMIMRGEVAEFPMVRLPRRYRQASAEDRLSFLCRQAGPWYVDFVVSWRRCRVKRLELSYAEDVQNVSEATVEKILAYLGVEVPLEEAWAAFSLDGAGERRKAVRFNVGKTGRGQAIPLEGRRLVHAQAEMYSGEVDFSGLL